MRTWEALADGLLDACVAARLEATWAGRTDAQRCQAWIERQQVRIAATLKSISQGLGDKPYCVGTHFSLADIAVGCALGYLDFRFPDNTWRTDYPNIVAPGRQAGRAPELHRHGAAGGLSVARAREPSNAARGPHFSWRTQSRSEREVDRVAAPRSSAAAP